jgi:excinuclease ABC subunit A
MSYSRLVIEGAKQNNLKNITLTLPHDKVIAVTGVSGSGKSSLAFDTIFAEGQWRFIESLSTYARLFLEKLDRPAVDAIKNIRPAIALEQRNPVRGSRSTVGTITELYDYFRLLYAKAGVPFCVKCGAEIHDWSPSAIIKELLRTYPERKAFIIFESTQPKESLKARGFHRVMLGGEALELDEAPVMPSYEVVLDRLVITDEARLSDSIEMAYKEGASRMKVVLVDGPVLSFSSGTACDVCGTALPEPSALLFSFNHPVGACPVCRGFGNVLKYSEELIVPDPYLTIQEGAIEPWQKPSHRWWRRQLIKAAPQNDIPLNKRWLDLSKEEKALLFKGGKGFYGINDFFEELEGKRYKLHVRVFLSRYRKGETCPECGGKRLRPDALAYKIKNKDIAELCRMPISELTMFFEGFASGDNGNGLSPERAEVVKEPVRQINLKLAFLNRVGLDYLDLNREGRTLSGGEYQRVNLSNQLASRLTGSLYVLDEPTVGLHPKDTARIASIMKELSDLGNTLIVVEHDRYIIESADWVVELGPGGGHLGGDVVFAGPGEEFLKADTLTSNYVKGNFYLESPEERRQSRGALTILGASGNNLKDIDVQIPLGTFTVVTGVSGSGKSSLVVETVYRALARNLRIEPDTPLPYRAMEGLELLKGVRLIDQSPIGRTPRSNPVTYLKIFDHIRKLFAAQAEAKAHGYGPGFFSFNVAGGRCPTCNGEGYQRLEMYFFEDLYVKCEDCGGKRYGREALNVLYRGKDISQVLEMTVDEAADFFADEPRISERLLQMQEIGLGYLRLGQPATTLSGGEAQRLKICAELGIAQMKNFIYILDEPTVGLHYRDVIALLRMLQRLVQRGNSVLVIEHNLDVINAADHVIDLGPEGGGGGGEIIFEGTPDELLDDTRSHTAEFLRRHLNERNPQGGLKT